MNLKKEDGFSLVELLIVVVILGVVAALAIPGLRKSIAAAENQGAFSGLRTIGQSQASFYSTGNRYGRLDELNTSQSSGLGTTSGTDILKGPFRYQLTSDSSNTSLQTSYTILASRSVPGSVPYVASVDQTGVITQIVP